MKLLDYLQFLHQVLGIRHFVDDEEQIAHIHADGTLHFVLESDVAAHGFPVAIEGQTDEVALCIDDGAARVAAMKLTTKSPFASA